jgi:hypothetical protein
MIRFVKPIFLKTFNAPVHRRPLPLPRGGLLAAAAAFGCFEVLSSTSRASRFNDSGKIHDRMVDPRTESVE